MSQTPTGGDYFASQTPPAETSGSDPYATPVDPYATPATDYAAPADPYQNQTTSYVEPTGQGTSSTPNVAKDEAANVKGTAVQEGQQVAGTAKEEAKNVAGTAAAAGQQVAGTAVQAGQQVAGTAVDEAQNVVAETVVQAQDLARQAVSELQGQAGQQKDKIATLVHSYASELGSLASGEGSSGPITDLTQRASDKAREVGQWLENREPREVLDELSALARRRPAAFLVGSALAGVLVGRLTRNLAADAKDDKIARSNPAPTYSGTTYTETSSSYSGGAPTYTGTAPTYDPAPVGTQDGRYGDLASEDRVVGYDTPVRGAGQDIR